MTNRVFTFLYGAISYAFFFASFLYAIGFVGNFAVHKSLDSASVSTWPAALLVDLGLLGAVRRAAQRNGAARVQARGRPGSFPPTTRAQHLRSRQ